MTRAFSKRVSLWIGAVGLITVGAGWAGCASDASEQSPTTSEVDRDIQPEMAQAVASAQSALSVSSVKPVLKCVDKVNSTTYRAHFGYTNSATATIAIAVGFNNRFWPNPINRGQATSFLTGTKTDVVQVTFAKNSAAVWILGTSNQIATSTSKICPATGGTGGATATGGAGGAGGTAGAGGVKGTGGAAATGGATGTGGATQVCPATCDDHNPCTIDVCNASTAFLCSNVTARDGTVCTDNDACTSGDACQLGICVPGPARVCAASDVCHLAGVCAPSTGVCSNPVGPNGTACDDGNLCTSVDVCQAGICTGGSAKTCVASDACHVAGTCNPSSGLCSSPNAPEGLACDDALMCTLGDACRSGVCTPTTVLTPTHCLGGDACEACTTDNCIPSTDGCDTLASASDRALCEDLYACFTDSNNRCVTQGDPSACWCGTQVDTCATSNDPVTQANGPCLQKVFAAAKTTDAASIKQRLVDPDYPLGRAVNLISCRGVFCAAECQIR